MDNLKWKAIYLSDPQKEKSSKSLIGRWRLDILEVPRDNSITIKEKLGFRIRVTYIWLTVVKIGYEHMLLVSVSFNFLHLFAPTCTLRLYSRAIGYYYVNIVILLTCIQTHANMHEDWESGCLICTLRWRIHSTRDTGKIYTHMLILAFKSFVIK